ncbi:hypothetical protein PROFUN_03910 [Planoprotostelium fungivorum]|uniref:Uncharacterized protein n=1 Tax=Planoprotostelium fungivorum TaxID=1890364 RepID=A0A2P6MTR3_9EUKA|nr:hypothetical protein PROFUN_03910 [Planoprotostelium fungivorum]
MADDSSFEIKNRKRNLEMLVEKRTNTLDYLKRLYSGEQNLHYLNIVRVQPQQVIQAIKPATLQKRAMAWCILGYSLASTLKIENTPTYVKTLIQLMEEYDYLLDHDMSSFGPNFKSREVSVNLDREDVEEFKPKIHKVGNTVYFEFLQIFNIPCDLDYLEIIFALSDVLKLVFGKLDVDKVNRLHYELILRFDSRMKHHFYSVLEKEMYEIGKKTVAEQTADVNTLFKTWLVVK